MKNIIKIALFVLLISGPAQAAENEPPIAPQVNDWWSSLKSGFNTVIEKVQKPAFYINIATASLFSAPYIANKLASWATTSGATTMASNAPAYARSLATGTATYLKPLATSAGITKMIAAVATEPNTQKVAAGLTAAITPYITTWILMYRAHSKFNDAIRLITPPVDITDANKINPLLNIIRKKYNIDPNTRTGIPLTRYSDELTWYINRLWYLQIFFIGTDKRTEIQQLIENLKTIRDIIAGTKELTAEQRNSR